MDGWRGGSRRRSACRQDGRRGVTVRQSGVSRWLRRPRWPSGRSLRTSILMRPDSRESSCRTEKDREPSRIVVGERLYPSTCSSSSNGKQSRRHPRKGPATIRFLEQAIRDLDGAPNWRRQETGRLSRFFGRRTTADVLRRLLRVSPGVLEFFWPQATRLRSTFTVTIVGRGFQAVTSRARGGRGGSERGEHHRFSTSGRTLEERRQQSTRAALQGRTVQARLGFETWWTNSRLELLLNRASTGGSSVLVIDQPEENLDNQTVVRTLVPCVNRREIVTPDRRQILTPYSRCLKRQESFPVSMISQ